MEESINMRPYGFDDAERLRFAHSHAELLREEWRLANGPVPRRKPGEVDPGALRGALRAARRRAGAVLISIGHLLLPADADGRRTAPSIRGTDSGC